MDDYVLKITFNEPGLRKQPVPNDALNLFRAIERAWPPGNRGNGALQLLAARPAAIQQLRQRAAAFIAAEPLNGMLRHFAVLTTAQGRAAHVQRLLAGTQKGGEPELMALANSFHVRIKVRYGTSSVAEEYRRTGHSDNWVVKLQLDVSVKYAALVP